MGGRVKHSPIPWLLLMILILGILLRLRGIFNPLLDDQAWRQADTAGMAFHMLGNLSDIPQVWTPMLSYDGSVPQRVELEFPFLPYLLAWTWTGFGWSDLAGRLWAILFSVLTIWGIYILGRLCFSERVGLWAAGIYALAPVTVYYGRVVMPEPVAQAFTVWALIAVVYWQERPSRLRLVGAGLLMALAILAKLPQLMIFPVALLLGFWPLKGKAQHLIIYSVIALLPPLIYYSWVHAAANEASQFVTGILSGQVVEAKGLFWQELITNLREGFSLPVLILASAGALTLLWKIVRLNLKTKKQVTLCTILLWCIISLAYILIICSRIPLDYYLVPVMLPIALAAGLALSQIEDTPGVILGVLVLSLLLVNSTLVIEEKYAWNQEYLIQANWLRENTPQGSVLVLSDPPPMTFYYAQRVGYRLHTSKDQDDWHELTDFQGDYLVQLPNTEKDHELLTKVQDHFPEIAPGIYQLKNQ